MNEHNLKLLNTFKYYLETAIINTGKKRCKNTIRASYNDVKSFLEFISDMPAEAVMYDNANKWIESLGDTAAATRNRKKASMHSFYNFLLVTNVIEKSPLQAIKSERIEKGKGGNQSTRDWLEIDEINRFKVALVKEVKNPNYSKYRSKEIIKINALKWNAIFHMILETGIRVTEATSLERSELRKDKDKGYFIVILKEKSKNGKMRKIPLPEYVFEYIKEYRDSLTFEPDNQYIFLSQNGNELDTRIMNIKVKEYAAKANIIKHLTVHSLRHTFASYKLNVENISPTVVASWMGHDSKILEKIYYHQEEMEGEWII